MIVIRCDSCGEDVDEPDYIINNGSKNGGVLHFCNRNCFFKYLAERTTLELLQLMNYHDEPGGFKLSFVRMSYGKN